MEIRIIDKEFSICKLLSTEGVDLGGEFTFFAKTDKEVSLVTPADKVPNGAIKRDNGWRALGIVGELDFSLVGILSRISTILAAAQIGIFAISTFDTDYIFVKKENLDSAIEVLMNNGYKIN